MSEEITEEVMLYHKVLMTNDEVRNILADVKNITPENIIEYEIGLNPETGLISIPVKDETDRFIEIKYFDYNKSDDLEANWLSASDHHKTVYLSDSVDSKYFNKKIKFDGIVIGKDFSPYLLPKKVVMECQEVQESDNIKEKCSYCPLSNGKEHVIRFRPDEDKEFLVKCIGSNDTNVTGSLRKHIQVPAYNTCRRVDIDIQEKMNVEELQITTEIDYAKIDSEYVIHKAYNFGQSLKANQVYSYWGTAWNDPHSQQGLNLVFDSKGATDSLSKWQLTDDKREMLKVLRPEDQHSFESLKKKMEERHADLGANVTKMIHREDVIAAFELVYFTPLNYHFDGEYMHKGWGECCIVGDTRTGKTETIKSLINHVKAGEFITSGENTSVPGLLGGIQQTTGGNRWTLTFGKFCLNDKRAIVIDEADNLATNGIIGKLSGMRSSGVVEIVKIQTQRALARTRAIYIANPLNGRMNEYNYGVDAVKELFVTPQDLARLDFAMAVSKEEISDEEINSARNLNIEHKFTSEVMHNGVMLAWNMDKDNIIWEKGAEKLVFEEANRMGNKYTPELPLVIGAEMRVKIAKMSCSVAILNFSCDDEKEEVEILVTMAHVKMAVYLFEQFYDKQVFGYADLSYDKKIANELRNPYLLNDIVKDIDLVDDLLHTKTFTSGDLGDLFGLDMDDTKRRISNMRKCRAITKKINYYVKTPAFIRFLKEERVKLRAKEAL